MNIYHTQDRALHWVALQSTPHFLLATNCQMFAIVLTNHNPYQLLHTVPALRSSTLKLLLDSTDSSMFLVLVVYPPRYHFGAGGYEPGLLGVGISARGKLAILSILRREIEKSDLFRTGSKECHRTVFLLCELRHSVNTFVREK